MNPGIAIRSGDPAFAIDVEGRLISWNEGAQRLLGYAADVIGRPCAEIVLGRDVFGNLYCHEQCNPRLMARTCEAIRPFEAEFRKISGEYVRVSVSSVCICFENSAQDVIVHVLRELPNRGRSSGESTSSSELVLMVSDIEGSTEMMERIGEGSALDVIHDHNRILRECLEAFGGVEVQHTGDGMIASFDSAAKAARCAIAVQQDCARHNQRQPTTWRIALPGAPTGARRSPRPQELRRGATGMARGMHRKWDSQGGDEPVRPLRRSRCPFRSFTGSSRSTRRKPFAVASASARESSGWETRSFLSA